MTMAVALFRVADYDWFRKGYDEGTPLRRAAGVVEDALFRMADDPNTVLAIHHFEDLAAAQDFFDHPYLKELAKELGTEGSMRVEYFDPA